MPLQQCPQYLPSITAHKNRQSGQLIQLKPFSLPPILSEEDKKKYEQIPCPFCNSNLASIIRHSADIVKCNRCSTVYLRTRPNNAALEEYYQNYAHEGSYMHLPKDMNEVNTTELRRKSSMKELLEFIKPEGILLDVGCGWGAFLLTAREAGFSPTGVELTGKSVKYANEVLNIPVVGTQFLDTHYEPNSISAVIMFHVFEHITHPKEVLEKIYRILKPGGMFCGMVPNIESFYSTTLKENWEWLDHTAHYVHYSPYTIRKHLEDAGLKIERLYTCNKRYSNFRPIAESMYPELKDDALFNAWSQKNEKEFIGEEIDFFARKPL